MKYLCLVCLFYTNLYAFVDPKIGGTLIIKNNLTINNSEKGTLIISVFNQKNNQIIAKQNVLNPKFPQAFVITPKHLVSPQFELKENVYIRAEYLIYNNQENKKFKSDETKNKNIEIGNKDVTIELIPQ